MNSSFSWYFTSFFTFLGAHWWNSLLFGIKGLVETITRCYLLLFVILHIVTFCHPLSLVVPFAVTCCATGLSIYKHFIQNDCHYTATEGLLSHIRSRIKMILVNEINYFFMLLIPLNKYLNCILFNTIEIQINYFWHAAKRLWPEGIVYLILC